MSGIYCLVVELNADATIEIGALGEQSLPAGGYAYVGSARNQGGFSRLDRHRAVAAGEREVTHWHVDYLLTHCSARVFGDVRMVEGVECRLAAAMTGEPVADFGCSDCGCSSHLFGYANSHRALAAAKRAATDQSGTSR